MRQIGVYDAMEQALEKLERLRQDKGTIRVRDAISLLDYKDRIPLPYGFSVIDLLWRLADDQKIKFKNGHLVPWGVLPADVEIELLTPALAPT